MAKFSLFGDEEDDDEGPSCPPLKRPRFDHPSPTYSDDDDEEALLRQHEEHDDDDYDGDQIDDVDDGLDIQQIEGEEHSVEDQGGDQNSDLNVVSVSAHASQENHPRPRASDRDRSISVFLTDPDVLDCSICFDPLTIPVFQCENGHIACCSCCTKLSYKCPSCSLPIGYNRCRAIEKVLESVKIVCQNRQYGCKETVTYSKKKDHEKSCTYEPCSCPLTSCNFVSSFKQLYSHFSSQHKDSAVPFHYGLNFTVRLNTSDKFRVLQECNDGVLFILKNEIEVIGNLVSLSCIRPCSFRSYSYELVADYEGNSLKLVSFTESRQEQVDYPLTVFLLIPPNFFGSSGQLRLNILIYSNDPSPACSGRSIEAS